MIEDNLKILGGYIERLEKLINKEDDLKDYLQGKYEAYKNIYNTIEIKLATGGVSDDDLDYIFIHITELDKDGNLEKRFLVRALGIVGGDEEDIRSEELFLSEWEKLN